MNENTPFSLIVLPAARLRVRIEWEVTDETSHIHLGFCPVQVSREVLSGSYEGLWLDETEHEGLGTAEEEMVHEAVARFVEENPDPIDSEKWTPDPDADYWGGMGPGVF